VIKIKSLIRRMRQKEQSFAGWDILVNIYTKGTLQCIPVHKMKIKGISNSFNARVYKGNNNAANGTYRITTY